MELGGLYDVQAVRLRGATDASRSVSVLLESPGVLWPKCATLSLEPRRSAVVPCKGVGVQRVKIKAEGDLALKLCDVSVQVDTSGTPSGFTILDTSGTPSSFYVSDLEIAVALNCT